MHSYRLNSVRCGLAAACLSMLIACDAHDDASGYRQGGAGSPDKLSQTEWATFVADQTYINDLAAPNTPIRLNMADPRQRRFVLARLKMAGKTPGNSPTLFEEIENRRQAHEARGYKSGLLPGAAYLDGDSAEITDMHFIETASLGEATEDDDGLGAASSTFPNGTLYTYADVNFTDSSGYPVGEFAYVEEYGAGENVTVATPADPSLSSLSQFTISSYKVEYTDTDFVDSYVYTVVGAEVPTAAVAPPKLCPLTDANIVAPRDLVGGDHLIKVCLQRGSPADCDYSLLGVWNVKVPLKGSVSICSAHTFDVPRIDLLRNDLNNGVARPDAGLIKLILTNVGGGCDVTDDNALLAKMSQFWNHVAVSPDWKTLSWDLTGTDAAFFDDGCQQIQNFVKLTMTIPLPLTDSLGNKYNSSINLSNEVGGRPDYQYDPMTMRNSCLAEGTEIQLAGGDQAPIESLQTGARVSNPYHADAGALTVTDVAKGIELAPMVRIGDEQGRTLLMTEMHPIATVSRGMVQARNLREGDVVRTVTGPSKLAFVRREAYDGKVYNLKVGSEAEMASLGADQTVMYANGFLVGDEKIQGKYEQMAMDDKGDVVDRIPMRLYRDYLMSQLRK